MKDPFVVTKPLFDDICFQLPDLCHVPTWLCRIIIK